MCWAWSGLVLLSCTSTLKLAAVGTRTAVPGGGGRGMTSLHNEDTHGNLMVSHCLAPHTELTCTMKQQGIRDTAVPWQVLGSLKTVFHESIPSIY